ncbi:MAG: amidohydrolase [Immundisolibacteraceae bacterium]|nr:amidohydrolase [Immundisolibacteraceae bacterium]
MSTIAKAVDADGHIMESLAEMAEYAHPAVKELCVKPQNFFRTPFPTLDGVHWPNPETYNEAHGIMGDQEAASTHRKGSGEDWLEFLEKADVEYSVMYTSEGLTVGALRSVGYAVAVCQAYNDYVGDRYRGLSDKLLPMALIPMQSPKDAVIELRRAVNELKLPGAMLPSSGLPLPLGHEHYWPVYEEAARLGCVLGVHGGPNGGMGLDGFDSLAASHVIHHPMGLMIACASMVHSGIYEKYPDLKVAYTEGGSAWCTIFLDRMARNAELQADMLGFNKTFEDYLTGGQILIGCEGEEPTLEHLIKRVGIEAFAFSTDYPHEVDFAAVRKQINATKELSFMDDVQKSAFLGDNARRFFNLG